VQRRNGVRLVTTVRVDSVEQDSLRYDGTKRLVLSTTVSLLKDLNGPNNGPSQGFKIATFQLVRL
jgi:hypothetical protein